jgi:tetratricopeptide (TPR) repeat protein
VEGALLRVVCCVLAFVFVAGTASAADQLQFAAPATWVKPLAIPSPPPADNRPVDDLLSDYQVRYDSEGQVVYQHEALRFQSPEGLQAGAVVINWNPAFNTVTVHSLHIIRGAQVIDLLATQQFTVLRRETSLERAMLSGVLTATLQPNGLQVGDVLELSYSVTDHDPVMRGHSELFFGLLPNGQIDHLQIRETWPSSKAMRWREVAGLSPASVVTKPDGETELVVAGENITRAKAPDGAPPRFSDVSNVEASDFKTWEDVSTLMAPLYVKASALSADSPLKAEAAKIRAASGDPKIEAAAALRLVQDQTRYLFLGMNQGGYVPADADVTWTRRFGDCKGKTALLLALLHELGIEATPAIVSTEIGDGMDERLPNVELFDHVLVRAVIAGKIYWLDGTRSGDRSLDSIEAPAFGWALQLTEPGAKLEKLTPEPLSVPQGETNIRVDASAGLDAVAPVHVELVIRGDAAALMRLGLGSKTPAEVDKALRDVWTSAYPRVEIKSVKAEYDDATGEERLTMDGAAEMAWDLNANFGAREYATVGGQLGVGVSFKRDVGAVDAPFAVSFPVFVTDTETVVLPQAGKGFSVVGEDVDKTVGGTAYKRTSHIDAGVFTMVASARSLTSEISAADAAAAKPALREMSDVVVRIRAPAGYADGDKELQIRLGRTPQLASEYADRAYARTTKGDYQGALKDYDQAIQLKPDDGDLLNARCFTRGIANTDLKKALDDCDAALALAPHDAAILDSRGFVFFRNGQLDKAMTDFNAALEIDPKQSATLYVKGLAERRLGDAAHGENDISAAKTLDHSVVATYARYGVTQ